MGAGIQYDSWMGQVKFYHTKRCKEKVLANTEGGGGDKTFWGSFNMGD